MEYYLKAKQNKKGKFELYKSITKNRRKIEDKYFFKLDRRDNFFIFVSKSDNDIAIYKIRDNGKLISKKRFSSFIPTLLNV